MTSNSPYKFNDYVIFSAWESDDIIENELWRNIGLSISAVIVVTFIFLCNIQVCMMVVFMVTISLVDCWLPPLLEHHHWCHQLHQYCSVHRTVCWLLCSHWSWLSCGWRKNQTRKYKQCSCLHWTCSFQWWLYNISSIGIMFFFNRFAELLRIILLYVCFIFKAMHFLQSSRFLLWLHFLDFSMELFFFQ